MANPKYKGITAVGAGAITEDQARPEPLLDRVSEYHYVKVTNPLPMDFIGKVAQSRQINAPLRIVDGAQKGIDENTLKAAGLDLKNPDHPQFQHVSVNVAIKSGQTINLRGNEAKVIVRQLVNELMAYEGKTIRQGNPAYRREYEEKIVQGIYDVNDLLGENRQSEDLLIKEALEKENEKAFPDLEQSVAEPTKAKK